VGRHHNDHRRIRRHLPHDPARQGDRQCVLYMWCPGNRVAHSHYRQQFCRILQESDETGKSYQKARSS